MSHPLDDVKDTPWGLRVSEHIEKVEQGVKDKEMTELKIMDGNNGSKLRWFKDPIAVLIVVVLQTISFTVFLTTMNGTLNGVVKEIADSKGTAYTKVDAHNERELMDSRFARLQDKDEEMVRRIALLEAQINELRARVLK